jgi:alkanesulfonate monooxygenase SsuD/methylene tetrahydromethanopterin reductase-like flavin-dependent oxidoreductase (luciferase family)
MKFGIFHTVQLHESQTAKESLNNALEEIMLSEELGLDETWLGEHHFSRHGLLSGFFSFIGHVAAKTSKIRIGTAITVLPFHNPIHVASESAMIDVLSNGRFDLGVGRGYQLQEFEGLGIDIEQATDRFREGVDVIVKAWTEEKLTYKGKFTNVEDKWIIPKPIQNPIPIYVAVSTTPATIDFAAKNGHIVMVGGPTAVLGQAPDVIKTWREKMDEYGNKHKHIDPPVQLPIYVAPTMEEAINDPKGYDDFSLKILSKIGTPISKDGTIPKGYDEWVNRQKDREGLLVQNNQIPLLRGTPEVLVEKLKICREKGVKNIFGNFGFPGMDKKKSLRSIELFCTQVLPEIQKLEESESKSSV